MSIYIYVYIHVCILAQSGGAVKYTHCISAEKQAFPDECPGYDTKQSDSETPVMLEL